MSTSINLMDELKLSQYALQILSTEYNYRYLYNGVIITAYNYDLNGDLDIWVSVPCIPPRNMDVQSSIQRWMQIISNTIFCSSDGYKDNPIEIRVHQACRNTIWTPERQRRIKREYESFDVAQFLDLYWRTAFPTLPGNLSTEARYDIILNSGFGRKHWWKWYVGKERRQSQKSIDQLFWLRENLNREKWDPYT